jgi:hypothetical protein
VRKVSCVCRKQRKRNQPKAKAKMVKHPLLHQTCEEIKMAKNYKWKTRVVVINKHGVATETKIINKSLLEIVKELGIELQRPLAFDDLVEIGGEQVKDD